jgi:hypothetical protein
VAVAVHTNCKIYLAKYEVTGDFNKVSLDQGATEVDVKVFSNTAENIVPGMWKPKVSGDGFVQMGSGTIHEILTTYIGSSVPITVCPDTGAAGSVASFVNALEAQYNPISGKVGDPLPFTISASAVGTPLVSGKLFVASGTKTSTSTSSVIQLGAVSATQKVYIASHIFSNQGSSPTLDIVLKSAALVGFGSPTTRITLAQQTAAAYDFQSLAGAITDQFWRVDYTIGGSSTPGFSFVVVVGIF